MINDRLNAFDRPPSKAVNSTDALDIVAAADSGLVVNLPSVYKKLMYLHSYIDGFVCVRLKFCKYAVSR